MCIAKAQQQGNLALQVKTLEAVEAGGLAGAVDGPFQRAGILLMAQDHGQRGIARAGRRELTRRRRCRAACQTGLDLQPLVSAMAAMAWGRKSSSWWSLSRNTDQACASMCWLKSPAPRKAQPLVPTRARSSCSEAGSRSCISSNTTRS